MTVDAIVWDYDGTLVNSAPKNMSITRDILGEVAPRLTGDQLPGCLKSEPAYHEANHGAKNWRELYLDFFGLSEKEADIAGTLWSDYQRKNRTPVLPFEGIIDVIRAFAAVPQGICSQNSADNIKGLLDKERIAPLFRAVVGYEDVPYDRQKPSPDAGLMCLSKMFGEVRDRTLLAIGDHETDVIFARNISRGLHDSNSVISVAVSYSGAQPERWENRPDRVISDPRELTSFL